MHAFLVFIWLFDLQVITLYYYKLYFHELFHDVWLGLKFLLLFAKFLLPKVKNSLFIFFCLTFLKKFTELFLLNQIVRFENLAINSKEKSAEICKINQVKLIF